uniref:(northern house mosquito) hypothetical protein n=1 Tax=Culex pipiens TaxID=7175 RepID=A0A8D8B784_CULPI
MQLPRRETQRLHQRLRPTKRKRSLEVREHKPPQQTKERPHQAVDAPERHPGSSKRQTLHHPRWSARLNGIPVPRQTHGGRPHLRRPTAQHGTRPERRLRNQRRVRTPVPTVNLRSHPNRPRQPLLHNQR